MMKYKFIIGLFIVSILLGCNDSQMNQETTLTDRQRIDELLENYKMSINKADTTLAKSFWLTDSRVTFIHPRGHERGWEGIKSGIYEMFKDRFSKRDLKSYDETITIYGDMAILEFYWVFDATFSGEDPDDMQTKGRETQVLKKIDGRWRIVHIHYSGMPASGNREGF